MATIDVMPAVAEPASVTLDRQETGLHSPPETNTKDTSDSELSDLEPDQEMSEPTNERPDELTGITPDHYSPDGTVPVFKPTMEEFDNFQRYLNAVNQYGMRHGIIKVIPPAEWLANQPPLDDIVKSIRIKEPIKQDIMGTSGTYRQANILHQRSYNLPQWRQLCDQSEHQPPARRGERRANQDKPTKSAQRPKAPSSGGAKKKGANRSAKDKKAALADGDGPATPDRLPTPESPSMKAQVDFESTKQEDLGEDECPKPKGGRQPTAVSVSSRRKFNRREAAAKVDEEAFKDFKYQLEGADYSQERCDELERAYWKTLTYAPPLYGADMMGSLFDDRTKTWNLGRLENLLDVLGTTIPGVNTAYLYLGMWKATFAWHLEDVDLYSINYLHFGAPKQWYSISQGDARRFEAAMRTVWPSDAKACDQFLRHKTFLISPSHLMQNFNIRVNKIVHNPGEFVITFPYGYHSGYNLGYNCAEAVNFALDSWLEYGRVAKKCDCSQAQDSVWIDVQAIERKMRGEETEYEETEDEGAEEDEEVPNGLTGLFAHPNVNGQTKTKTPKNKRKRPTNNTEDKSNVKRIRVRIKAPTKEPCILCPNDIPSEPLLSTEDGQKAHKICALYIPETSISEGEKEIITDVRYINKARLDLKCNYCRSKKGACFQCSQKKCTRAYHATCAAAAGVLVERGEIPVFGEDGTEYKDWEIEFSCRFHRSKRDKKVDIDGLGEDDRIIKAAKELKQGEACQMQYFRGDIFAGAVVENRRSEEMLLVDILPRGERVEVEYKWLLVPDPADYHLPKPSAKAIPMPKSFKDKESLNTTKRHLDDIPRADDVFGTGFTWAEFKSENISLNNAQVKVELEKDNQIWFYLGKTSTEAKAQFTEDPAKPRHNPKGHFLDTIPRPTPSVPRQSYAASYPSVVNRPSTKVNTSSSQVRPSEAPDHSAKEDKPYIYKPRARGDYHVDPQAYLSQQSFLQRSSPSSTVYNYGSDPSWLPTASSKSIPETSSNLPTPLPAGGSGAPVRSMAPPQTQSRPPYMQTYTASYTPSPKSSSSFHSKSQTSKPNPFAKYGYLQKEHNRSPLEYKSPYRPGGGFMNGYQGNVTAHWKQTLFQGRSGSETPQSGQQSHVSAGSSRTSSSPIQPFSAPHKSPASYEPCGTTAQYQQALSHPVKTDGRPNSSDRREHLHPAIRQEYGSLYHHQYQSTPQQSTQSYQGPMMQPPAMYDRQASQLHSPLNLSQRQASPHHPHQPYYNQAEPRPQATHSLQYNQANQASPNPQQHENRVPAPIANHTQHQSSHFNPNVPSKTQKDLYQGFSSSFQKQQQQQQPAALPSAKQQIAASPYQQQLYQAPLRAHYQESKLVHPQHQFFQKPQPPSSRCHDLPDVPADSTSLIEKMMKELRKAT